MRSSKPVTAQGALIAVAAEGDSTPQGPRWFLVAIDPRLDELDRQNFVSAEAVERAALAHLRRNHPVTRQAWPA